MRNLKPAANSNVNGFLLTIVSPSGTSTSRVEGDAFVVGRADDCQVCITHDSLNDHHLTVLDQHGQCWIEDRTSTNGTYLNGKRLEPGTAAKVEPGDWITLGYADLRIAIVLENSQITEPHEAAPPLPAAKSPPHLVAVPKAPEPTAIYTEAPLSDAGRELQEAHKKATLLIQEATVEAERKIDESHRRAFESHAKADELRQRKIAEAYTEAEKILRLASEDSDEILFGARKHTSEIRQQAETFALDLRRQTEADCESLLQDAQQTARALKAVHAMEAEALFKRKEEEIFSQARAAIKDREAKMEEEIKQVMAIRRAELEQEMLWIALLNSSLNMRRI